MLHHLVELADEPARDPGLLQALGPLPIGVGIVASIVVLDLAVYVQHVLFHGLPALWRVHRVHHTDPELDVTTGVRFHPVEILVSAAFKAAVVGVLGAPVVGDLVYGAGEAGGMLLHAASLTVPRGEAKDPIIAEAPLPERFGAFTE